MMKVKKDRKQQVGRLGEKHAARYLKRKGYRIKARNIHLSHNEIDLIASNKAYIVFVEVKTRTIKSPDAPFVRPSLAVDYGKRKRTLEAAYSYIRQNPTDKQPRIDVIEVLLFEDPLRLFSINHIENAFGAQI